MNRRRVIAAGIAAVLASRAAIGVPKANARVGYLELLKESDAVNLRVAEEYRIALPRDFLLRADRVIR